MADNDQSNGNGSDAPPEEERSSRGFFEYGIILMSIIVLGIALISAAKVGYDALVRRLSAGLPIKASLTILIYLYGLATAAVGVNKLKIDLLKPVLRFYAWSCMFAVGTGYLTIILLRLHQQNYTFRGFIGYTIVLLVLSLAALGFHLIIKGYDRKVYAVPILVVSIVHLASFMFRAIFTTEPNLRFIAMDLGVFIEMIVISIFLLSRSENSNDKKGDGKSG